LRQGSRSNIYSIKPTFLTLRFRAAKSRLRYLSTQNPTFVTMGIMQKLVVRDDSSDFNIEKTLNPAVANLLVTLIILLIVGMILVAALVLVRRKRRARKQLGLPLYDDKHSKTSNHRGLTIMATPNNKSTSTHVNSEKQILMDNSSSPPPSPVPEIRITFPEEEDDGGRRKSGRVVVVRISETGSVGMEPCREENLPPYQQTDSDRFQSLDLERIGGLKENHSVQKWS
jgi:hypothetical protein